MNDITVLSLFDGMSCGQIALQQMGVKVATYYAAEIDKHAIKQTQLNFPNTKQLGSVTDWQTWDIDWSKVDLLLAGSPCQGFSFSGKQLAFDDPRSKLFFVFIDILNHVKAVNPKVYFLLENVRMAKQHELVISRYCNIAPVLINSALVSAQNRERNYWTNIYNQPSGFFGNPVCNIPQPKDRGIFLKHIIETDVDEKYFLSKKMLAYLLGRSNNFNSGKMNIRNVNGKATCVLASAASCDISDNFLQVNALPQIVDIEGKASCFTAGGNSGGLHSQMDLIACVAMRGREAANGKNIQQLEPRTDGKSNCLTSVQKDNLVIQLNPSKESEGCQPYQQNRVYDINGKNPALTTLWNGSNLIVHNTMPRSSKNGNGGTGPFSRNDGKTYCLDTSSKTNAIECEERIRRLTPTECSRLQTIPAWYKWQCSDTQQYRMLGNGWTVEVIIHILSYLPFNN